MKELIEELKNELISELNLEEVSPEDINEETQLFGDGLGLDSIDALEIMLILERKYGIKVSKPDDINGKEVFRSIGSLAEFIAANRKK